MNVTEADGHLMVQSTGQKAYELFLESETAFFYRAVDAHITFEPDPDGHAVALVLHQNGMDRRAPRI